MGNTTSFSTTPPPTPNTNEGVGKLPQSMSGPSIEKNISPADQKGANPDIKPNPNIETTGLNAYQADRLPGSANPGGDAKPQGTEQNANNSKQDINKTDNSEKATNTAQDASKQNDTPGPNDAAAGTNVSVLPDTSSAEKPSGESTATPEVNANNVASENSTNNVNENDNISGKNNVTEISTDPKIQYDEKHGGYWVLNVEIPTIFKDEANAKKFMDIMKDFQFKCPEQAKQIGSYSNRAAGAGGDLVLPLLISIAQSAAQPASWGFISGNNEMRNEQIQKDESKTKQNPSEIERTKSEIESTKPKINEIMNKDPLNMSQDEFKAWQTELDEFDSLKAKLSRLQTDFNTAEAELKKLSSFWDYQPTDETKLIAVEFVKEQQEIIQSKFIEPIEKKRPYAQIRNFLQQLINLLKRFIDNSTLSNRNFLIKIADNIKTRSENTIKGIDEQFAEQLTHLPPGDFVKAIVNLANKPAYQIACGEGTIGGNNLKWGRGFTRLTNGLNSAIKLLLIDRDASNKITVKSLNDFARKYGQETLNNAIRTLYTAKLSGIDASELKGTYEAYWEQSGRKGKCPVDKVFDNKIRELNWPDSKLKPPESVANPA